MRSYSWQPSVGTLSFNHHAYRVHHAKRLQAFFREHKVSVEFTPPYSSSLNCVEHMWAALKRKWRKLLASFSTKYDRDQFIERDILKLCGELTVTNDMLAHQLELFRRVKEDGILAWRAPPSTYIHRWPHQRVDKRRAGLGIIIKKLTINWRVRWTENLR